MVKKIGLIIIAIMIGYIPLIVRMKVFSPGLEAFDWFYEGSIYEADLFLYYKARFIIAAGAVAALLCVVKLIKEKKEILKRLSVMIPVFIYLLFILLSGVISQYRSFAFKGICEDFESVPVMFSLMIICLAAYLFAETEEDLLFMIKCSIPGILIMIFISLSQLAGADFFQSDIGARLILPAEYYNGSGSLSFPYSKNVIYATLYNSNYVPQYFGMLFFIFTAFAVKFKNRNRYLFGVLSALCLICTLGSGSKTGLISLVMMAGLFLLLYINKKKPDSHINTIMIVFSVIILICAGVYDNSRKGELDRTYGISNIETNEDNVVFYYNEEPLYLSFVPFYEDMQINVTDKNGNSIGRKVSNQKTVIEDGIYAGSSFEYYFDETENRDCVEAKIDKVSFVFGRDEGGYCYLNGVGRYVKMRQIENLHFFRNSFLSGRGNIWNHSIPLLKNCLFFGSGAGTFGLIYPQDDYIYKTYNSSKDLFDFDSHSFYLQQMLENGLVGFLILAFFIGKVIYDGIKNRKTSGILEKGLLLAVYFYLMLGLTNSSNVCTAPLFWVSLGTLRSLRN